ncbi:hypothetical protein JK628_18310 [Shewanella sp. KX20019]|uniref:hypothetical protein n=1 Tax=Shewanella sp. KX20019 TaxID=2803864 RepID=UPI0019252841|nr:hypothetical protein [Shewanella sp. KX20019]QQX79461.1 hypothetical protein JK628_18310 [Shewanella sp. KX20019]
MILRAMLKSDKENIKWCSSETGRQLKKLSLDKNLSFQMMGEIIVKRENIKLK